MMKSFTFSILIFLFLSLNGIAQSTFDDKKQAQTGKPDTINFNTLTFPKTRQSPKKRTKSTVRPVNFQVKANLDDLLSDKAYKHNRIVKGNNGIPIQIESQATQQTGLKSTGSIKEQGLKYLKEVSSLLQIQSPEEEFLVKQEFADELGQTHVKLQQVYRGIPIFGSQINLHFNANHQVFLLNGRNVATPKNDNLTPSIDQDEAYQLVLADLNLPSAPSIYTSIIHSHTPKTELVIYNSDEANSTLAWHITTYRNFVERWEYFIDAHTGDVVEKFNHTCYLTPSEQASGTDLNGVTQSFGTHYVNETYYMINSEKPMFNATDSKLPDNGVGVIITLDLKNQAYGENADLYHITSSNNQWNNPTAVSAHHNADVAYEYYRNTFGRNSINGKGGTIYSIVNVADENGNDLDNAFWNGFAMFYGNGNIGFTPLAGGLDVGGHEMSHGVIENSAGLVYKDQPGAINESMADVFGVMIDRDDWLLGEDVVKTSYFKSGAMRNMKDPHNGGSTLSDPGWQPSHMSEFYTGTADNGGVHINSGIPNRAFYLFANEVGKDKAEQVYYRALTTYLTASSQFVDLRLAIERSATDLYGENTTEVQAAQTAFDAVGIYANGNDNSGDSGNEVPVASGEDYILVYEVSSSDPNTLYIYDNNNNTFTPISQTELARKPSVSDDGSTAIMVTADHTLNYVTLEGSSSKESVLSNEAVWGNVSLSKDGTKIAAVGTQNSNKIVVADLVSGENLSFQLYNPTTVDGVSTGNVEYADALEWDYTGQYIMYDALNTMQNANGQDIEYWDVGFIKVWDNGTNDFGDGTVQKLFSNLSDGVSIGNPSFSKTSRNIVAFDMYNANTDAYAVLAANIETGTVQTVFNNARLGFPNYSKSDGQIVFNTYNSNNDDVIGIIDLDSDKITPSGQASVYISGAIWPIWYTVGERQILKNENEITEFKFMGTNPVSTATISGSTVNIAVPENSDVTSMVATFSLSANASANINGTTQLSGITSNNFTTPLTYTIVAEDGSSQDYVINVVKGATSSETIADESSIEVFPNPFGDGLRVYYENFDTDAKIRLINMIGQVVYYGKIPAHSGSNVYEIHTENLATGTYTLQIINHKSTFNQKVIKNK